MTSMDAKDLTKECPRSPYAEMGGFPWLPRLIDKVRAKHAGTIGAYIPYPCGSERPSWAPSRPNAGPGSMR